MQELVLMIDNPKKVRIILGKVGLDPHDRGVLVLSKILTDAGMEVIYLGRFQTAEAVVRAAIEEDAQIIALSDHCGVMVEIAEQVIKVAKELEAQDIPIIAGGFLTEKDIPKLEKMGVTGNFTSGTPHEVIVDHVKQVAGLNEKP
jgi:methylmalonyl-CoA mutase C-terminal domain/subunit